MYVIGTLFVVALGVAIVALRLFKLSRMPKLELSDGPAEDSGRRAGTMPRWLSTMIFAGLVVGVLIAFDLSGRIGNQQACDQGREIFAAAQDGGRNLDRARAAAAERGFELDVIEESDGVTKVDVVKNGRRIGFWRINYGTPRYDCVRYRRS